MKISREFTAVAALCAALAAPQFALAQFGPPKFVKAAPSVPRTVSAGKPFTIVVNISIDTPYHIQANSVKDPYIPTELRLTETKGFHLDKVTYPKPIVTTMSGERIAVFEGKVVIKADVTADKSLKPGKYTLPVVLKFQGCNEQACFPPATLDLKSSVTVIPGAK